MTSNRRPQRDPSDPWLRLGRLDVGSTVAAVVLTVAVWLVAVAWPRLRNAWYLSPEAVFGGEVWRVITWPFAEGISLWSAITLFFLWYFGSDLERHIGPVRMAWLLLGIHLSLTVAALALSLLPGSVALVGWALPEFIVLLVWIAEYPTRRFLFNIPAWALGVALLAIQVLSLMAARGWTDLLLLLIGLVASAVIAKQLGLLSQLAWVPGGQRRTRPRRVPGQRQAARDQARQQTDRDRLDALLDKINAVGIGGLSEAERKELVKLRDRLRGGR